MKKIILILTISAFSIVAYAGSKESAAKAQAASADKATASATCQDAKTACCEKTVAGKNDTKKVKIVHSPKAAGQSDRAS